MLRRAIASAFEGNQSSIELTVVVNGRRFDPDVVRELKVTPGLRLLQLAEASSPAAILAGRRSVRTDYFSYLDDDDEYLPGAVDARVAALQLGSGADVVATNGYRRSAGQHVTALRNLRNVATDPLQALFVENWLPSCGAAFRTATVPERAFEDLPRHIHWSFLAFTLAMAGKTVVALDEPTFVINDTPGSASKLESYLLCHVEVYERMLAAAPPRSVRSVVARRLGSALHEASDHFRETGRMREAWAAHFRSLRCPGGLQFLSYTRHLIPLSRRHI